MIIVKSSLPKLLGVWAITIAPFVFVLPQHANNIALLAHERVHYNEQLKWLIIPWWIAYLVNPTFRKNAEIRGYKRQISLGGCTVEQGAYWLSKNYKLSITRQEVVTLLQK